MRNLLILVPMFLLGLGLAGAQSTDEKAVAAGVELFRKTMVDPDQQTFDRLIAESLSYGHSSGLIEDKQTCIASMISGKFNFESLALTDQTIEVVDSVAVVRHTFFAHTHDAGKDPGIINLKVLMVWHKKNNQWRLLARQAVKF